MQAIAAWLVARPQNAVLGLVATLILPAPQLTSGIVMVLLLLTQDRKLAVLEASMAAAILVVIGLVLRIPLASTIVLVVTAWVPVLLLTALLVRTRSLTLTLQISVLFAVASLLIFDIVVADKAAFWEPYLARMAEMFKETGLQVNTDLITAQMMTVSAVIVYWMLYAAALSLGYSAYRSATQESEDMGRFRALNFGRVIAVACVVVAVPALLMKVTWLQDVAYVLSAVFVLQGLALLHWLRANKGLPGIALVAVYVTLPLLQVLLVFVLALVGYSDAWFDFRRRLGNA